MHLINNSSDLKETANKRCVRKKKNCFSRIFFGYQSVEYKFLSSACFRFISYLKHKCTLIGRLKHSVSSMTEQSMICGGFSALLKNLLSVPMRSYGILMFFFGIFTLLVDILRLSASSFSAIGSTLFSMIFNVVLIFSVAAFMTISSKSLGNAIINSRILSLILFDILNFDKKDIPVETGNYNNTMFVFFGLVFGIVSIFIRIQFILLLILALIVIYAVFNNPESGIILTIFMVPFTNANILFTFSLLCCISVLFKVMRNKRVMKIAVPDIFVFLLMAVILLSGINGIGHMGGFIYALKPVILLLFGWIINNTIKTTALAEKCVNALILSVSLMAVTGITISVLEIYELESRNALIGAVGIVLRGLPLVSDKSYIHLAVLGLPFSLSLYRRFGFKGLISSFLCIALIILSFDITSWISLVLAGVLYFSVMYPMLFLYFGVVFSLLTAIYKLFPAVFSVIIRFITSATDYYEYISLVSSSGKTGVKSISEFMFSGAGVGERTLDHVFNCLFGFESTELAGYCPLYMRIILQVGLIGIFVLLILYCLVLSNCLSLFYRDKICKNSLKYYVISCITSCSVMIIAGVYCIDYISPNVIFAGILIMYLSFIFRKCSEIEFTPEAHDIDNYRDIV